MGVLKHQNLGGGSRQRSEMLNERGRFETSHDLKPLVMEFKTLYTSVFSINQDWKSLRDVDVVDDFE